MSDPWWKALGQMRRAWYVWQMGVHKDRLKAATKQKMLRQFEDSVIVFAETIKQRRDQIEQAERERSFIVS